MPASVIATGRVSSHASAMLRMVPPLTPERCASIVPAMPDDSTWVVETGSPNTSAAPIVPMATSSAEAPWA